MRVARQMTVLAAVAGPAALPAGGLAQSAGSIPNQPWYPAGYLDMREAAASQVEDFPRNPRVVLMEDWDDPNLKTYDVIDCMLAYDLPEMAPYEREVGSLALDIARMRHELAEFGYAKEVYDGPLLDYERAALAAFDAERSDRPENPEDNPIVGDDGGPQQPGVSVAFDALGADDRAVHFRHGVGGTELLLETVAGEVSGGQQAGDVHEVLGARRTNDHLFVRHDVLAHAIR